MRGYSEIAMRVRVGFDQVLKITFFIECSFEFVSMKNISFFLGNVMEEHFFGIGN